jgi:hypothetical protein
METIMNSDKLSEVFDVQPISKMEPVAHVSLEKLESNEALEHDYDATRRNLHNLLAQGEDALYHALEVAKNSEHPRAFEVVGGLMKNLSDINTQLLDLHRKKQIVETPRQQANNVTNNAIFVGSTNELSKMLENLRKEK